MVLGGHCGSCGTDHGFTRRGKRGLAWTSVSTGHSKASYDFGQKFLATQHVKQLLSYVDRVPGGEIQGNTSFYGKAGNQWEVWFNACFCHKAPKQRGHRILSFREAIQSTLFQPIKNWVKKGNTLEPSIF